MLSREEAADYVNLAPSTFDRLVAKGLMPRAKRFHSDIRRRAWDRFALDRAIDLLPDEEGGVDEPATSQWHDLQV
jgi:predicted DNA-binding transcriptional regulator AlpA